MSILIKGMEMPKDCPMCIAAHYNKLDEFTGCEIVSGKKYAVQRDAEYANSSTRPDWCPLVPVPPHGRLGDLDRMLADNEIYYNQLGRADGEIGARYRSVKRSIELAPTIIPEEEE